jgi:hypothetical protein
MPEHPVHRAVCRPLDVSEVCRLGDHHANLAVVDFGSPAAPGRAVGRGTGPRQAVVVPSLGENPMAGL